MSRVRRLTVVLALNLALVAGLAAAGIDAHSLGVLAEGGDYLLDAAGAGLALLAIRLSAWRADGGRPGLTSAAALVNAGWLLVLELIVAGASIGRLATRTPQVHGLPVLVASGIAAVVMAAAALVLRGDDGDGGEQDLSVAAVLLDTVADAAAAAGVAVAGAVILVVRGWYWLDPAVALIIAVLVAYQAVRLIRTITRQRNPRLGDQGGDDLADLSGRELAGRVADRELDPLHGRVAGRRSGRPGPDSPLDGQPAGRRGEPFLGRVQQQMHHRDLRRVRHDPDPGQVAHCGGDLAGVTEVLGHQGQPAAQAAQRGGGVGPQAEQRAAHPVPPLPHLGQDVRRPGHAAAGQRADALVEGHVDAVEQGRDLAERLAVPGG